MARKKGQSKRKKYFGLERNQFFILLLVFVFLVSMGGAGMVSFLIKEDVPVEAQISKAQVIIDFGNYTRVNQIVDIESGETANDLFNKNAQVTLDFISNIFVVTKVESGENMKEINDEFVWDFYVNGRLTFDGPDMYKPKHGDTLELIYEENPF